MNGTDWNDEKNELNHAEQETRAQEQEQEFEAMLARALRRIDAPEGFAARVTALAQAEERTARAAASMAAEKKPWWQMSGFGSRLGWKPAWGAMAAILVAGVLGGHEVHERRVEQARVQASRNFDASVQITDRALEHAREQLKARGVELDGEQ